ncbi:MAG: type II toxin-antitoxin system RelE/ParE family toxin [Pseudomonadota bacterium]
MALYKLTTAADADLDQIWRYTNDTWGARQADIYLDKMFACLDRIGRGLAVRQRYPDVPPDLIAHRCADHIIFWLERAEPRIVAILSSRTDLTRRLSTRL